MKTGTVVIILVAAILYVLYDTGTLEGALKAATTSGTGGTGGTGGAIG